MKKITQVGSLLLLSLLTAGTAKAQLNTNPDKFLGNITTRGSANGGGIEFRTLWNQLTPENETKWSSVQGSGPNSWNWGGATNAYNYCKQNNLLFKFHCLAWGSQYPSWIEGLTPEERYKAIVKWMDECKKKFPDLKVIDVVNEAVEGHQKGTYLFEEALGGKGATGWDWIINAFKLAHERWPDAILIYNDFNTFQWQRSQFIQLVKTLRDNGAPIDAYGCQSHDCTGYGISSFRQAMDEIQNNLKMPMYSTEYDIGTGDDNLQLTNYSEQIPYMWEKDYCAGITLWGFIYGATWTTDGNSGIIRNGQDRPAMKWLREYMKTDKAKNAKSPFPGMIKEADLYIAPPINGIMMGEESEIPLNAKLRTKKIERIDFYAGNQLYQTITEAPWVARYTPGKLGTIDLKAVMVADDGTEFVRYGAVKVLEGRRPIINMSIPGIIQAENFDIGVEGVTFHDSDMSNTGNNTTYRSSKNDKNGSGVDISSGNSGQVVSDTRDGEWMDYTVNVKEDGYYSIDLTATSGVEDAAFSLSFVDDGVDTPLTESLQIPCYKKNAWSTYRAYYYRIPGMLTAGKHNLRLKIEKGGAYIDKIQFKKIDINDDIAISVKPVEEKAYVNDTVNFKIDVTGADLSLVTLYINSYKEKSFNDAPYEYAKKFTADGNYLIQAFATDAAGLVSPLAEYNLKVEKKRIPHKGIVEIPGEVEAENFDEMGEGWSFHDSDANDQGAAKYRSDNEGVDIIKANGGYALGYTAANEWVDYTVDIKQAGIYNYYLVINTGSTTGKYQMFILDEDGKEQKLTGALNVPNNRSWVTYPTPGGTSLRKTPWLPEGRHTIRFKFLASFDLDKLIFEYNQADTDAAPEAVGIEAIEAQPVATYTVYALDGAQVTTFRASADENLSNKVLQATGKRGTYVVKNNATGESKTIIVQ